MIHNHFDTVGALSILLDTKYAPPAPSTVLRRRNPYNLKVLWEFHAPCGEKRFYWMNVGREKPVHLRFFSSRWVVDEPKPIRKEWDKDEWVRELLDMYVLGRWWHEIDDVGPEFSVSQIFYDLLCKK